MDYLLLILNIFAVTCTLFVLWFGVYVFRLHITNKAARAVQREKAVAAMREATDKTWTHIISQVKIHNQRRDKQ